MSIEQSRFNELMKMDEDEYNFVTWNELMAFITVLKDKLKDKPKDIEREIYEKKMEDIKNDILSKMMGSKYKEILSHYTIEQLHVTKHTSGEYRICIEYKRKGTNTLQFFISNQFRELLLQDTIEYLDYGIKSHFLLIKFPKLENVNPEDYL
jgi:hypothetical protein